MIRRVVFTAMVFRAAIGYAEGQAFAGFTNKYGAYGTNFIAIAPWTSQGIFYQGDPVTISNRIGTAIEVYDFHGNPVANAAPPVTLTNLRMGHYFVQVDGIKNGFGDRSQFSVWPKGYTNHPHSDIGEPPTGNIAQSNRFVRMAPGFSRLTGWWSLIVTNSAGTNDWTLFDQYLHGGSGANEYYSCPTCMPDTPVPLKVLDFQPEHNVSLSYSNYLAGHYVSPYVDETNSLSSFINDFSLFCSNTAVRYTNSFTYEILNEPGPGTLVFPDDPYNSGGAYPASLAVSGAVRAIRYVCPSCQTWGPALQGLRGGWIRYFTNSYDEAGYSNANVISYHAYDTLEGPVDQTVAFTSSVLVAEGVGTWLPVDVAQKQVSAIQGKPFAITEGGPASPDVLGKTNSWWITQARVFAPAYKSLPWTWQTMTYRLWKYLLEAKGAGAGYVQTWLQLWDYNINDWSKNSSKVQYEGQDLICGWDSGGDRADVLGCGPLPVVDGEAMVSWWLNHGTPLANWLSGSPMTVVDPMGGYTNGTPGLHFWMWQFADGSTNTIIWADEGTAITTNFGAGLTDIFSNQWTGPIGEEPVIAWGWPNNSLGGSYSIQPVAAFTTTSTYGPLLPNRPVPVTVTFTDVSSGAITNRAWQFGDGFVFHTPDLEMVHHYTTPGTNSVRLIVSGPSGVSTASESIVVTTFPPPLVGGTNYDFLPVTVGTSGGDPGGTNSTPPNNTGGATGSWRIMETY